MSWVQVNLPWRLNMTPEMQELTNKFIFAVNKAGSDWAMRFPDLHELEIVNFDLCGEAIEAQDRYPWLTGHLKADNIHTWHQESMKLVRALDRIQYPFKHLVNHRYAYVLKSRYIDKDADVVALQYQIAELRARERSMQFCNHPACKVGVLINVSSGTSLTTMLIGDVTPTGLDGGCCSSGLKDDDIIVRYKDMREVITEAING